MEFTVFLTGGWITCLILTILVPNFFYGTLFDGFALKVTG
jgi:hypothetical protein